jgi:hypothetical protein
MTKANEIPCPFTYANGKKCPGHVVRVEAFNADIEWVLQKDGTWKFRAGEPRSHCGLWAGGCSQALPPRFARGPAGSNEMSNS